MDAARWRWRQENMDMDTNTVEPEAGRERTLLPWEFTVDY